MVKLIGSATSNIIIVVPTSVYLLSLLALKQDWAIFSPNQFFIITTLTYVVTTIAYIFSFSLSGIKSRLFDKKTLILLLAVMGVAIITRFMFLKTYPFVSLGDEVRDGGLNASQIVKGSIDNLYGMGRYDAHGLVIPAFSSLFYRVFGPSVYTYRVPAAILGTISILISFIFVKISWGRTAAFWASLALATLPLHLFYSRTEVVIAFSLFWAANVSI